MNRTCCTCGESYPKYELFDASGFAYHKRHYVCASCIRKDLETYKHLAPYVMDVCAECGITEKTSDIFLLSRKKLCADCLIETIGKVAFKKNFRRVVTTEPTKEVRERITRANASQNACTQFIAGAVGGCSIEVTFTENCKSNATVIGVAKGIGQRANQDVLWVRYSDGMVSCLDKEYVKGCRVLR